MNAITNAYNYYMTTYAPKPARGRYETHKQNELKDIYNSIVKQSKESPLYLYDQSASVFHYAINIKEEALGLKSALTALTNEEDPNSILGRKIANSSNPNTASVEFIGDDKAASANPSYEMTVEQLATPQVNTGKFKSPNQLRLIPNDYSFEIQTDSAAYEFQFHVSHNDTNKSVQTRLANLINSSKIGISAKIVTDSYENTALQLTSSATGRRENGTSTIFNIVESESNQSADVVDYLGINRVTQYPDDAIFTLDGKRHTSSSNNFTINHMFEVNIKAVTDEPIQLGFKTDTDTIAENIKGLIAQYNSMMKTSESYTPSKKVQTHSLPQELNSLTNQFYSSLESIGLNIEETGKIEVDDSLLYQALDEDTDDTVQSVLDFKSALINKTDQILLNPMEYVDRTIVAYKNPGKTFTNPYVTSVYSGMLFNSYC